jgi:DNA-binding IclR family transcriptional regulator
VPHAGTRYPRAVATAEGTALSSVDRALRLLEELARHGPLGATELANRTGCAKATAFRLARTLQARGFVVQNQDSSYRLGPRCLLLATGVHTSFDVRREALPAMEALRDDTGETVQLTVLEGPDVVYVEQVTSSKPVRSVGTMGQRAPAHCVSGGLSQLALLPFERVRALLPNPLPRPTAASIPSLERLAGELDRVRARGYAVNRGGFRHDVGGVGTSVLDAHGRAVAALNICVPLYRLEELGVDRLGELVMRAATEVSQGSSLAAGAGAVGA